MIAGRRGGRKERLSKVYLDDYPVTLMGDEAQPPLERIVRAGGKDPGRVDVVYLTSPADRKGRVVDPAEIVDRTAEPTRPIYLRSIPKPEGKPITTGHPEREPDEPGSGFGPMGGAPGADPVISQLGRDAVREPRHVPGVFRSPSQQAAYEAEARKAQEGRKGRKGRRSSDPGDRPPEESR